MAYNYEEALKDDIRDALNETDNRELIQEISNRDQLEDELYDRFWIDDSVTGNGSGSYTFNAYKAAENVIGNEEYIEFMVSDGFETYEHIGEWVASGYWEDIDVSIRCYLLRRILSEVLDEIL